MPGARSVLRRTGVQGHLRRRIEIDRGDVAISNDGSLRHARPGATQHTVRFSTSPKMSSYLVAMAVGDFQCLEAVTDSVPIRSCATPDKKNLGRIALESAQAVLAFTTATTH